MLVIIIVVIFALLLVGVYFLGKSGAFNSKASPEESKTYDEKKYSMGQNAYLPVSTWGQFTPNGKTDTYSGSCINYTAQSSTLSLGFPSIDSLNDKTANYIKSTQECVDPDQILAQAGTHTCQNPNNGAGGTGCITSTSFSTYSVGDYVPVGVTEGISPNPYYISCGSKACPGELGLIVPNFTNVINPSYTLSTKPSSIDPNSNYPNCIQNNGVTEPNTGAFYTAILPCDLSDPSQVFRMVRYSFDDSYVPSVNPTGIYAAIIHRATGFYLAPDMEFLQTINPVTGDFVPNSYTYYFDSLIVNTDPVDNTNKYVNLILINPTYDNVRNGIYWLLQNQTPDATKPANAIDPNNSLNCDASDVYPVNSGVNRPSNCLDTGVPPWYNPCNPISEGVCGTLNTDTYIPYSPQQFVYVPNIYLVPKDTTDLVEYWTYLTNQYSIQLGSINELNPNDWSSVDDNYKGVYASTTTYSFGDIVYYQTTTPNDQGFYVSINAGDNLGNPPSVSSLDWKPVIFDYNASPTSPASVLPLTLNYSGNWSANGPNPPTTILYNGPDVANYPKKTGDVVTYNYNGNLYTYVALQNTLNPPAASVIPPADPSTPINPSILPNYPPVPSSSYWQQISTYSSAGPINYIKGQIFASTKGGTCFVYIGDDGSNTTLPDLYTEVSNIPMLKKFLTKIPADVYYYTNQGPSSGTVQANTLQAQRNPFYGSDGNYTNTTLSGSIFNSANGFIGKIPTDIHDKYYSGGSNEIIAAIVPKLNTSVTIANPNPSPIIYPSSNTSAPVPLPSYPPKPVPFSDNTRLLDSQFIGATNLSLQLQSPISVFRDPISIQYKSFNPFNVTQ
jgi:hypothetical protein